MQERKYQASGVLWGTCPTAQQVTHLSREISRGDEGWEVLVTLRLRNERSRTVTESEFVAYPWAGSVIHGATLTASKGEREVEIEIDGLAKIRVQGSDEDWVLSTRERLLDSLRMCQPGLARWAVRIRPVLFGLSCMLAILMLLELLRPDVLAATKAGMSAVVSFFLYWYLGYATRSCIVFRQPDRAALRDHIRLMLMAAALVVSLLAYWGS